MRWPCSKNSRKNWNAYARESIHENVTSIAGVPSWNLVMLKHILKSTGASSVLDIWPNLELFIHGGVSFIPYREAVQITDPLGKHALPGGI